MSASTWISIIGAALVLIAICGAIYFGLRRLKAWIDRNTKPKP